MNNKQLKFHTSRKLFVLVILFLFFNLFSNNLGLRAADDAEDVEKDINKIQEKIKAEEQNLKKSQAELQTTQSQIYTTTELIKKAEAEIKRKESEIVNLEQRIKLNQGILSVYIQEMYYDDNESDLALVLDKEKFVGRLINLDQIFNAKERVLATITEIKLDQSDLSGVKEQLSEKKEEHEDLLAVKKQEKGEIVEEIAETQASISELNAKMNKLKSDLSRILGKAYDTGEIKDAIKFANKVTGVRKGFIFGVLSMESGGNPEAGKCNYKNSGMSNARKEYFRDICEELDYDYKNRPVSCSPKGYSGTGGAMGAAQFMPDTWAGYKSRIASATGHTPPDPWNLVDGVMAMALKLKADEATADEKISIKNPCNGKSVKVKGEIYASMRYLGWSCYAYTNYAPAIQNLANGYDKL